MDFTLYIALFLIIGEQIQKKNFTCHTQPK